jgi:hypothetical protein
MHRTEGDNKLFHGSRKWSWRRERHCFESRLKVAYSSYLGLELDLIRHHVSAMAQVVACLDQPSSYRDHRSEVSFLSVI